MSKSVEDDNNEDTEAPTTPFPLLLILLGALLYAYGKWKWAVAAFTTILLAVGLATALSKWNLLDGSTVNNHLIDDYDITMKQIKRYYRNNMTMEGILQEIQEMEQYVIGRQSNVDLINDASSTTIRIKIVAFLEALTRRCCRERETKKKEQKRLHSPDRTIDPTVQLLLRHLDSDANMDSVPVDDDDDSNNKNDPLPSLQVCGYLAAHFALQMFPNSILHLQVAQAALALYAVVSQHDQVQQRLLHQQHAQRLDVPIHVMQFVLAYARDELQDNNEHDEIIEHQIADTVQKACLLLGALADNHPEMATAIVDHDGLQAILDAASWFRHHEVVVQWSLWAIFQLCYEHERNQRVLVEAGGLMVICTNLQTLPSHAQIVRHGLGIMLDTLRLLSPHMPNLVQLALAAGLHDAVLAALKVHASVLDIKMMGDELLRGTGYKGPIPTANESGVAIRLS